MGSLREITRVDFHDGETNHPFFYVYLIEYIMSETLPSIRKRLRTREEHAAETQGRIDAHALGLTAGILWSLLVAFLELAAHTDYGERWRLLLADLYPGYSHKPGDLLWGSLLAFVDAYVLGYVFGSLYNRLAT